MVAIRSGNKSGASDFAQYASHMNFGRQERSSGRKKVATVDFNRVIKSFGSHTVLKDIDFSIGDGEFVVLVGPSGCGKSTLLRMLAGLEDISGGEVAIGGAVVNDVAPKDRDIAMVFQSYALYPHMTVEQNLAFGLKMRRNSAADIKEAVTNVAKILGLENLLGHYPRQLSGGQRQRVAMGRAIVRKPKVFLFDEPLSNLDAKLRVKMRAEIRDLHQRLSATTVYVTHDQIEAMTMADKIVVLRAGRIEQVGKPLDIYDAPANVFVAGFIGSPAMNFLNGQVRDGVFESEMGIKFQAPRLRGLEGDIIIGIRPEHLSFADEGLSGKVVVLEPTGSETEIVVEIGHGDSVTQLHVLARERVSLPVGQAVKLTFN
ncbi:MAG: ABC transporter ATP-binding protein, partial [Pikeienuella sp.]